MIKFLAIAFILGQALARPGMGGMGMGGMGMGMGPWGPPWMTNPAWNPWMNPAAAPAPGLAPEPAPAMPMFGKGGMAIGAKNKELGMNQAIISSKIKAAEDEIKVQNDVLKTIAAQVPQDECTAAADATATDIDNQLLTAFEACKMKNEIMELRMENFKFKQSLVQYKMAKKSCKNMPPECLTDATAALGAEPAAAPRTLADINAASDDCIAKKKDELLTQIDQAHDQLLVC